MTNLINRWAEFAHYKTNEIVATFTSGAMVANGVDERFTLADWSTVLGMIYVSSMLIPRLIEFCRWLIKKWREYRGRRKNKT